MLVVIVTLYKVQRCGESFLPLHLHTLHSVSMLCKLQQHTEKCIHAELFKFDLVHLKTLANHTTDFGNEASLIALIASTYC